MTRKQATIAVRSGLNNDEQFGCVVPSITLSSTYNFTEFNQPRVHYYSRRGNPTRDVVQRAPAELEGGAGAVMTSSGMSAIHLVCMVFLKPGDLLVAPHDCYGGSLSAVRQSEQTRRLSGEVRGSGKPANAGSGAGRQTEVGAD